MTLPPPCRRMPPCRDELRQFAVKAGRSATICVRNWFVSGHGFSRAVEWPVRTRASAPVCAGAHAHNRCSAYYGTIQLTASYATWHAGKVRPAVQVSIAGVRIAANPGQDSQQIASNSHVCNILPGIPWDRNRARPHISLAFNQLRFCSPAALSAKSLFRNILQASHSKSITYMVPSQNIPNK
jgi:hypothetical protein